MSAVIDLSVNLIAAAIIGWICVMFYFSYENYKTTKILCFDQSTLDKTKNVFSDAYEKAKRVATPENFEERELVPYDVDTNTDLRVSETAEVEKAKTGFAPNYTADDETDEDYNDVLVSQLEPAILQQHAEYVNDSNHTTRGASMQMEKSNSEDVVPQWGLRRIKYGKDILSKNALTVPSFEYTDDKTAASGINSLIGL